MGLLLLIAALFCFILSLIASISSSAVGNPLAWIAGGFIALTVNWILV